MANLFFVGSEKGLKIHPHTIIIPWVLPGRAVYLKPLYARPLLDSERAYIGTFTGGSVRGTGRAYVAAGIGVVRSRVERPCFAGAAYGYYLGHTDAR